MRIRLTVSRRRRFFGPNRSRLRLAVKRTTPGTELDDALTIRVYLFLPPGFQQTLQMPAQTIFEIEFGDDDVNLRVDDFRADPGIRQRGNSQYGGRRKHQTGGRQ